MVSVKKSRIFCSVFFIKLGLKIILSYGLEGKEAFEDDKYVNFESPKNRYLPKGLTHGFGQKIQNVF